MKFIVDLRKGIRNAPDDHQFWRTVLGSRQVRRACEQAKHILVIAGGHGSEVDVLVELHGPDIVKKIWFNDMFICFTNSIKDRYPQINIAVGNILDLEFDMKFSVVVGNPPYQDPDNDKRMLWNQVVDKAVELTEEDGYLALVTPATWLTAKTNIHNSYKMFEQKQVEKAVIYDNKDKPFNEGTTVSYTITKNTKRKTDTELYFARYSAGTEDYVANINIAKDKIWPGELTPINLSIHEKLQTHNKIKFIKSCEFHNQKLKKKKIVSDVKSNEFPHTHHVSAAITRYTSSKFSNHETWKVMVPLTSTIDKAVVDNNCGHGEDMLSLYVHDEQTANNIKQLFNTKFYKFIGKLYKNGRNQPLQNLFPVLDFTRTWTNEELYDHFNLTQEQRDYIDSQFK